MTLTNYFKPSVKKVIWDDKLYRVQSNEHSWPFFTFTPYWAMKSIFEPPQISKLKASDEKPDIAAILDGIKKMSYDQEIELMNEFKLLYRNMAVKFTIKETTKYGWINANFMALMEKSLGNNHIWYSDGDPRHAIVAKRDGDIIALVMSINE